MPGPAATVEPALSRVVAAAGLPTSGRFTPKAGWVSRAWVGDEIVVRLGDRRMPGAYRHEAAVLDLLDGSDVPHARPIAHGDGPDGEWSVTERLPGRTLHEAWPGADARTRRALVESLGAALHSLHRVPVPPGLLPPWLADAIDGGPWPAYHPPVVGATHRLVAAARRLPGHDAGLLAEVEIWLHDRLPLFTGDSHVLVHGDLHGSNVMVDGDRVTGLIDFAEALAQPADAELDTLLRWCARPGEFPPTPHARGLDPSAVAAIPAWLSEACPELFGREHPRERLRFYDMAVELAIAAHHPGREVRAIARARISRLLAGHDHLDGLVW